MNIEIHPFAVSYFHHILNGRRGRKIRFILLKKKIKISQMIVAILLYFCYNTFENNIL